jgi:hypothetical protein
MALTDQLLNHFSEKFGIVTVVNATFYEVDGSKPLISFDTLKMSNITSEGQQKEIRGGQGAELLLQYDFGRTANVEITDALVSVGSLEYLFGGRPTTGEVTFLRSVQGVIATASTLTVPLDRIAAADTRVVIIKPDGTKNVIDGIGTAMPVVTNLAPAGSKYTLFYTAKKFVGTDAVVSSTGVTTIPAASVDYPYQTLTDSVMVVAQADGDVFTFNINNAYPTVLNTGYTPTSTDIVTVYYISSANGGTAGFKEMILRASDFPPTVRMIGETVVLDADTGKKIGLQIEIPKFKLNANFTLSFDAEGDPSVFDFSGVALSHNGELLKVRTLGLV